MERIKRIKYLFTDVDGVLTDGGVYYSDQGEAMKKFSLRDGMGVERLRKLTGIQIGIITGENSPIVQRRAEKLKITELHLGIKDKEALLTDRAKTLGLEWDEIAYIGDDLNDLAVMKRVGFCAAPADAEEDIIEIAHYTCKRKGGEGAFREFCELLIKHT